VLGEWFGGPNTEAGRYEDRPGHPPIGGYRRGATSFASTQSSLPLKTQYRHIMLTVVLAFAVGLFLSGVLQSLVDIGYLDDVSSAIE
jgi:hypothetical protein